MTVKTNLAAAVVDLLGELDAMGFLDPGAKSAVDAELVDEVQADLEAIEAAYPGATFRTSWGGAEHTPTALELAHWLFDGEDPSSHRLTIGVAPTSSSEVLLVTLDVPRS